MRGGRGGRGKGGRERGEKDRCSTIITRSSTDKTEMVIAADMEQREQRTDLNLQSQQQGVSIEGEEQELAIPTMGGSEMETRDSEIKVRDEVNQIRLQLNKLQGIIENMGKGISSMKQNSAQDQNGGEED